VAKVKKPLAHKRQTKKEHKAIVNRPKMHKEAKKTSRFSKIFNHRRHVAEKHHTSKDDLTAKEKALLAAAGAHYSHSKARKAHPKKATKKHKTVPHHEVHSGALKKANMHKKMAKKIVHKPTVEKKALKKKALKKTAHKHVVAQVKVAPKASVKVQSHHAGSVPHAADLMAVKKPATKLPRAMRHAMEKITKAATKQAMSASTKANLRRASKDVAAHAVAVQTNVALHTAKKAVQSQLHHMKKARVVKEQNQKHGKQLRAQEKRGKAEALQKKKRSALKRLATNNAARAMVLEKPSALLKPKKLSKTMKKVRAIKAKIAALKPVKVDTQWAAMKAKADHEAEVQAMADQHKFLVNHKLSPAQEKRAEMMRHKLEQQQQQN